MSPEATAFETAMQAARQSLKEGQPSQAIQRLLALNAQEPDHAEAYELLGIAYTMTKDSAAARRSFEEATRRDPKRVSAHYNYALFLSEGGTVDEALEEVHVALYLAPAHAGAGKLLKQLTERLDCVVMHTAEEGFALVGAGRDPIHNPAEEWAQLFCVSCGQRNFITAKTCLRCGSRLPEPGDEEIVPVE